MTLSFEEKKAIIDYRIEKSKQTFKEAVENAQLGNWSLVANRLYYSIFYITLALNLNNGDTAKSHAGTFALFSKRFIQTGQLTQEESCLYRKLMTMRQSGDYDDLFDWEEEDVKPLIPQVKNLMEKLLTYL